MSKAYYHILIYSLFFGCKGSAFIEFHQILLLHLSVWFVTFVGKRVTFPFVFFNRAENE